MFMMMIYFSVSPWRYSFVYLDISPRSPWLDESSSRSFSSRSFPVSWETLWWSGSYLLHNTVADEQLLSSSRCTPNIQPGQTLFTWRGGSWVELRGWKRSQNVSRGSSSADAAQSHSWRRCTWHKIRWLCRGSGALRQKEEWRDLFFASPLYLLF